MLRGVAGRLGTISKGWKWSPILQQQASFANYYGSPLEGPPENYTDVEKSFAEWKWVERLIPPETVPAAPTYEECGGKPLPSGWTAPNPPKDVEYCIPRSKNHLVPVYTLIEDRGQIRETRIKGIEGNIWDFEKDVGWFLKKHFPHKMILTYTNECGRYVGIKGDYTEEVKEWLIQRGF